MDLTRGIRQLPARGGDAFKHQFETPSSTGRGCSRICGRASTRRRRSWREAPHLEPQLLQQGHQGCDLARGAHSTCSRCYKLKITGHSYSLATDSNHPHYHPRTRHPHPIFGPHRPTSFPIHPYLHLRRGTRRSRTASLGSWARRRGTTRRGRRRARPRRSSPLHLRQQRTCRRPILVAIVQGNVIEYSDWSLCRGGLLFFRVVLRQTRR